jgi:hypothetical protein
MKPAKSTGTFHTSYHSHDTLGDCNGHGLLIGSSAFDLFLSKLRLKIQFTLSRLDLALCLLLIQTMKDWRAGMKRAFRIQPMSSMLITPGFYLVPSSIPLSTE